MRSFLVLIVVAACGDNQLPREQAFVGASGDRLKLQWYLYQDGARQPERAGFYDGKLHTRCAPVTWTDDVTRCTPLGDPAVFVDAACTMEVGRKLGELRPKHFVGYDRVDGELRAARVYKAGDVVATVPTTFFELHDGTCRQIVEQSTLAYYDVGEPVERDGMVEVWPEAIAGERLSLEYLTSSEGLVAPVRFHDQQLGLDCEAELQADGSTICAPTDRIAAQHFADPRCEQPVAVTEDVPRTLALADDGGCTTYRSVGEEYASVLYRRDPITNACLATARPMGAKSYRAGAPLELAPITRTVEADPKRRLQRITLAAGEHLVVDTRLHDTATRSDCRSYGNGELSLCVPTTTATGQRLFANDRCTREVLVAELPRRSCTPITFAAVANTSVHAIGAPHTGPLYALDAFAQCRFKPVAPDLVPHTLGPAIPIDTFVGGVVFSER